MKQLLTWPGHQWLALPVRVYLGLIFSYACLHKIAHPEAFALDIATYQLLPLALINLQALILPWVELLAGTLLILGFRTRAAALLIAGMMVMFMIALAWALHLDLDMSCGCFASVSEDHISWRTMLRDGGWLVLALYVFICDRHPLGIDRWLVAR